MMMVNSMNKLVWRETTTFGSPLYGVWEGVDIFSVFKAGNPKVVIMLKCSLPGFHNKALPYQESIEQAKATAERLLTRWVAKRGLLFKDNIIVTDAMAAAGALAGPNAEVSGLTLVDVRNIIEAALKVRG